ncbi:glutathione synthase [Piscinibacter sakaiensis]|uniref:glutathione synthase n=1 Tax=Piscinibacter sakaiensis TaxID=1547922 RepID=UPI003AAD9A1F
MKLLFVADPLEKFKSAKDTTFAMMREASRRGHRLLACQARDLRWQHGGEVCAPVRRIELTEAARESSAGETVADWFVEPVAERDATPLALRDVDAVLMRSDPPFDIEYFYATHLLGHAERSGARVFNSPQALRDHPEKLAILEFPQWTGETLVTRDAAEIRRFHAEHRDIIVKPLDGMGGAGIFRVGPDGLNLGSIIESLNRDGAQSVMVQRYLKEISAGDKRILLIDGKPIPHALARIPQGSEIRGNMAVGGKGVAQPLSARDREIAEQIGPVLAERGLLLVGLDVIGDFVTEINVTSPTGFQEISQQTGFDVAKVFIDALEAAAGG